MGPNATTLESVKNARAVVTPKHSAAYPSFQENMPECDRKDRWNASLARNVAIRGPETEKATPAKSIFGLVTKPSFGKKHVDDPEG